MDALSAGNPAQRRGIGLRTLCALILVGVLTIAGGNYGDFDRTNVEVPKVRDVPDYGDAVSVMRNEAPVDVLVSGTLTPNNLDNDSGDAVPEPVFLGDVAIAAGDPGVPPAAAAYVPGSIESLICGYDWDCAAAIAVAGCESGYNRDGQLDGAWAIGGGANYGIFQLNVIHAYRWLDFWEAWHIPEKNIAWAYEIWSESGWDPWACRYAAGY
jgi:hypothetical protein